MDTQVPIKRKSSRRQTELSVPTPGSGMPTYVAIGAAGLALGIGYLCMKKIQQHQTDLMTIKEKEKEYENFQNKIKQLEENNQLLYNKLQKSEQIQNRLGTQFNSIANQLTPKQTVQQPPTPMPKKEVNVPLETMSAVPKPTQVQYVEPVIDVSHASPTRIVLSPEDKIV